MSVPVGVKSKDILRVRSTAAFSALSVAESYHAENTIGASAALEQRDQVERHGLPASFSRIDEAGTKRGKGGSSAPNVRRDILSRVSSLVPQALIPRM